MGIFGNTFGLPHLILILVIVLLLFGAPKLPGLARSLGQSMKIFRAEIKDPNKVDDVAADETETATETKPTKPKS
jgi:sec-independent protein translocase protein TatA